METAASGDFVSKKIRECQGKGSTETRCPYIEIIHSRAVLRVYLGTILYTDTFKNAVYIHTDAGIFKTYTTFSKFFRSLENDGRFLCCYKGCIVNMDRVEKIIGDDFLMDNSDRVQIRKRGGSQVKKAYLQYILLKQSV